MDLLNVGLFATALMLGIANSVVLFYLWRHYNRLTGKVTRRELLPVLDSLLDQMRQNNNDLKEVETKFEQHLIDSQRNYRHFSFKRFNPFSDTGGDQSFTLVLLDAKNDGFMISSLHSRENTRLYAKVISRGKSTEQTLSKEEQEVLNKAIKQK